MKLLITFLLIVTFLGAKEGDWGFERVNYYFENDIFSNTDSDYSDGSRLSVLLHRPDAENEWLNIPFIEELDRTHFISFSLTQQMFTPSDLNESELIEDDRPYAGWLYVEMGLHASSARHLDSLSLQLGIVGPASGMEHLQHYIHEKLGSEIAQGWDNQLSNEVGLQLNYQHKWRYVPEPIRGVESSIIPYVGGEFGNIAINANAGVQLRFGWNIPEDFGSSSIDEGGENGIPIRTKCLVETSKPWSLNFQVATGGMLVARDIFLDGNTFTQSHSVEKEYARIYGSFGISGRYKNFSLDYFQTYHSRQFENGKSVHSIGSVIISYLFSP